MQANVIHETTICVCVWMCIEYMSESAAWLPLWKKISITTSDKHFGKYTVNILCFSRSLSLEDKPKYFFYNILTEIYKGELKKDTRFCKHISFFLKRFKNHISALGFSSPMLSSERKIHSVYLSELLGIKAVTFKKGISHRVTNVRHSL